MNRVLVTGGSGFLGRQVLAPLIGRGIEVHGVFRDLLPEDSPSGVRWHRVNLLDNREMEKLIFDIRARGLIHFAWETTPGAYWNSPANLDWTATSLRLISAFVRGGGRRAVFAGSSAEYRWGSKTPLDESVTPLIPNSLYGHCKNALREIVESWATVNSISFAWGRIFNIFGPHERPERLIPRIIGALQRGEAVSFDDGRSERDFLYVGDAGEAFATLYCSDFEGALNIASGEPVTVRDVITLIAEQMGATTALFFDPARISENDTFSITASVEKLRSSVGWRPKATLQQRLRETVAWWRARGSVAMPR